MNYICPYVDNDELCTGRFRLVNSMFLLLFKLRISPTLFDCICSKQIKVKCQCYTKYHLFPSFHLAEVLGQ